LFEHAAIVILNNDGIGSVVTQAINKYAEMFIPHRGGLFYFCIEQCLKHIRDAASKIAVYNKKYNCNYETFTNAVQTDKEFLLDMESRNPLWEEDSMEWEYWHEEYRAWQNRLEIILQQ
jgi:hypothetical protein